MSVLVIGISLLIICLGFIYYWRLANKEKFALTFSNFFLGGGKVGAKPTHNTNWGLSLAFANAFWYFTYLAYHYGLQVFLYNLPWVAGVGFLGYKLMTYLRASQYGTIHTFLGTCYGSNVRKVASIATVIGYLLNCGFEVFYSSYLLSLILGFSNAGILFAITLAVFCGLYCMIGGYQANLITDVPQNKIAIISIILLIFFLWLCPSITDKSVASNLRFSGPEIPDGDLLISILVFTSLFNLVDMANWQSIAANSSQDLDKMGKGEIKKLRWAFYSSALKQIIAPGLLGSIVGVMLRNYSSAFSDEQLYPIAFKLAFSGFPEIISAVLVGFILLGFISATLSSADNYILASAQTLVNDLFYHKQYQDIEAIEDKEKRLLEEELFIKKLRRRLPIYAVFIVLLFAFLYYQLPSYVFGFQFIMYGTAICMAPSLFMAFKYLKHHPNNFLEILKVYKKTSFLSIGLGILATILPFIVTTFFMQPQTVIQFLEQIGLPKRTTLFLNLAPVFGISIAIVVFLIGIFLTRKKRKVLLLNICEPQITPPRI